MTHPMGPACVGYTPGLQRIRFHLVGQDDLFGTLEVELGHTDLIRNFLLMQWNMEALPT